MSCPIACPCATLFSFSGTYLVGSWFTGAVVDVVWAERGQIWWQFIASICVFVDPVAAYSSPTHPPTHPASTLWISLCSLLCIRNNTEPIIHSHNIHTNLLAVIIILPLLIRELVSGWWWWEAQSDNIINNNNNFGYHLVPLSHTLLVPSSS